MMKLGQMASYLDEGLPEPVREALAELQQDAPPMSAELAAGVVERELGAPPEQLFAEWDRCRSPRRRSARSTAPDRPDDGASAPWRSRCSTRGSTTRSGPTSHNAGLLGRDADARASAGSTRPTGRGARERIVEELDYALEAATSSCSPTTTATTRSSTCPTSSTSCRRRGC